MPVNNSLLNSRYPETFTLLDAIKDPVIHNNLEKFYVPEAEIKDSIFIKKDASIAITDDGPKRIKFIYLSADGKNITNPDSTYIQIPLNCKGFLARLSISRNQYTPENLVMDYLVDISKIKYRMDSVMTRTGGDITIQQVLHFDNIEFYQYNKIMLDRPIKDFILNKGLLFGRYFK